MGMAPVKLAICCVIRVNALVVLDAVRLKPDGENMAPADIWRCLFLETCYG